MTTVRDSIGAIAPPSMQRFWGSRLLYSIGVQFDALTEWIARSVRARFAVDSPPDGLALIGVERGIRRGFAESAAAYAARLSGWILDQKQKGTAFALARQLRGYLSGYPVRVRIINNKGAFHTIEADGTQSYVPSFGNWDWDGDTSKWSRYWVVIYPSSVWPIAKTYGTNYTYKTSETTTWGVESLPERALDLLQIINDWNAAHAECWGVILAFDDASFDPYAPMICDGTWGKWYKYENGVAVPSRLTSARYFERQA